MLSSRSVSPPPARVESFRVPLHSDLAPEQAVLWLRDDRLAFALVGDWLGMRALLGSEPLTVADERARDPFDVLDAQPEVGGGAAVVGGGWVGWLGYGLGARIERLPPSPPAPVLRPPLSLAFYDHVVVFDGHRWWFEGLWSTARDRALRERLAVWQARLRVEPPPARDDAPTPFALAANGALGHLSAVAECRERIAAGEVFQANICLRLEGRFEGDGVDLFARALPLAQPRFGALVDGTVSLSPERFLRREGRHVHAEPIKGTRPRVGTERERSDARDALVTSSKDAAEHVMIVDLMRNDLGRVCAYGTIVAAPPRVEGHAAVWHLVTTVSGRLRDEVGDGDLLRATFPPGSVTGAPKVQAMKVIADLEATRRELYTGAIGIASPIAGLDLAVAIRTFELHDNRIWFGVGGGIVADSEPELEFSEALDKAAGPIAAVAGRLVDVPPSRDPGGATPPRALRYGWRPDPGCGVFETVLVQDGWPVALEEHLDRLRRSLSALYRVRLGSRIAARATATASESGAGRARLRILADPDGSATVTLSPGEVERDAPVTLIPFALPGGLGAHKWRDRRLLKALADHTPGATPLLVDTDGVVLEAAYANVWIVEQDRLLTPPADGRILPGVTRSSLLAAQPSAREEPIELTRLHAAEEVFLTSSISGRHRALVRGGER